MGGLYEVLVEKYEWDSETAQSFADWLLPMLAFDTAERATAEECLAHPFLQDVWPPTEVPGGGSLEPSGGLQCVIDDGTEEDLLAAEGIEDEEVYDDYDLAHDDLESNLLAMSNSLQIQNLNIGGSNDVVECKNKDDIEIDDSNDDDQHSGSSSGDCFGSTGLFTAMWNKKKWRENSNICHQERSQPSSSIVIDRRPTLLNIVQHARVFFEWYWTINNINNYYIQSPMIFSDFKTNNLKKNPALIFFDEYLSWIFDVVAPRPAYIKLKKNNKFIL